MKTILFLEQREGEDEDVAVGSQAESRLRSSFRDNAFLLDEFIDGERIGLCDWHADGTSVAEVVPDLPALLAGEDSWRAVIVADLRTSDEEQRGDVHFDNPFDFPENYDRGAGDAVPESSRPLIRLTQMLGGIAERPYIAWNGADASDGGGSGETLSLTDNDISYADRGDEFDLLERYRLGLPRPQQIVCITPRDVDHAFAQAKERIAREEGDAGDASGILRKTTLDFWQRNAYPPQARFVVVDREAPAKPAMARDVKKTGAETTGDAPEAEMAGAEAPDGAANLKPEAPRAEVPEAEALETETSEAEEPKAEEPDDAGGSKPEAPEAEASDDAGGSKPGKPHAAGDASSLARRAQVDDTAFWLSFWIGVLMLSAADFPPALLRAYRLNRLTIGIDSVALEEMLAVRRAQWVGACRAIQERYAGDAARLVSSESVMGEMPPTNETIPVTFDLVSTERLHCDPSQVGFIKDEPENDKVVWYRQKKVIESELRELLLAPRRALRNAAARFRQTKPFTPEELEYCILNEYQKDRLADDLRAQEYDFTRDVGRPLFEFESHEGLIDEHGKLIEDEIEQRPTKLQALVVGGVALATLALGLWPYCTGVMGGVGSSVAASLVSLVCLLAVIVVWFASMALKRRRVCDEYRSLNTDMSALSGELSAEAARLEAKISSYASFRKRWSILQRQSHTERPTSEMHWLRRKELTLRKRIGYIDGIVRACGLDEVDIRMRSSRSYEWREIRPLLDDAAFLNVRQGGTILDPDADFGLERMVGPFSQVPYDFIADAAIEPLKVE